MKRWVWLWRVQSSVALGEEGRTFVDYAWRGQMFLLWSGFGCGSVVFSVSTLCLGESCHSRGLRDRDDPGAVRSS